MNKVDRLPDDTAHGGPDIVRERRDDFDWDRTTLLFAKALGEEISEARSWAALLAEVGIPGAVSVEVIENPPRGERSQIPIPPDLFIECEDGNSYRLRLRRSSGGLYAVELIEEKETGLSLFSDW